MEVSGGSCLQDEIQDFEALFVGQRLTPKEQEELAYKKTVLELALKRKAAQDELNQDDDYHIPQAYDAPGRAQCCGRAELGGCRHWCYWAASMHIGV